MHQVGHCLSLQQHARSAKHKTNAVLAYETTVHLNNLCICIRKLVYLIKQHNSANYQLKPQHAVSLFRLFDLLSFSHQPACLLINTMTDFWFSFYCLSILHGLITLSPLIP